MGFRLILLASLVMLLASCGAGLPAPTLVPVQAASGQELIAGVSESAAISLAGLWRAQKVDVFSNELAAAEFDDSSWLEVTAPASWTEQGFEELDGTPSIVVYRNQVEVPRAWQGEAVGLSTWFNPINGRVFVNGTPVEPVRKPFAAYTDVSELLRYGESNTITVTTMYEGYSEFAQGGPPRIGLIDQIAVTAIQREDVEIAGNQATFIHPTQEGAYPVVVFNATGSHFRAEREPWFDMGDELAREGIASLALALDEQNVESVDVAIEYLRQSAFVDPQRIILLGGGQGAPTMLEAAFSNPTLAGLIFISPPRLQGLNELGSRPVLLIAGQEEQRGLILQQAQESATGAANAEVIALPSEGGGTFLFTTLWSQVRRALLDFVQATK
jgi:predicted esterase